MASAVCTSAALAALLLLTLAGSAQANIDVSMSTQGQRAYGFTYLSNIMGYTNMTLDTCEMMAEAAHDDVEEAWNVYANGSNSRSGSGLRTFKNWAVAAHPGEQTYDMLIAYHSPNNKSNVAYLDDKIAAAFAAGNIAGALGHNFAVVLFKYMMHEVDAAYNKTQLNNTAAATGAPHNVDEGAAIWLRGHPDACTIGSPAAAADKYASDLGTAHLGQSPVNLAMQGLWGDLSYAATQGNASASNIAAYAAARATMHVNIAVYHAQAVLREAYAAEAADLCTGSEHDDAARDAKATAAAYYAALAPYLQLRGATPAPLNKVAAELSAAMPTYRKVRTTLQAAWASAKMPLVNMGMPRFAAIRPSAKHCKAQPKL